MKPSSRGSGSTSLLIAALVVWLVALVETLENLHSPRWPHAWVWSTLACFLVLFGEGDRNRETGRMVGALCFALFNAEAFVTARATGWEWWILAALLACLAWIFLKNAWKIIAKYRVRPAHE